MWFVIVPEKETCIQDTQISCPLLIFSNTIYTRQSRGAKPAMLGRKLNCATSKTRVKLDWKELLCFGSPSGRTKGVLQQKGLEQHQSPLPSAYFLGHTSIAQADITPGYWCLIITSGTHGFLPCRASTRTV